MTPDTLSSQRRSMFAGTTWSSLFAAIAAALAVAGTFEPHNLGAYALEGPKWPNGSTVVMQLSLGNAGRTLLDGNTSWNAAAAPALGYWNAVMGQMQFGFVMNSTAAVSSGDHVNSMAFSSTNFGQSFGSSTLAVSIYWYSGSTMTEDDVLFNTAKSWDSYRGALRSGVYDIQRVALHETGHAIGLAHSSLNTAIMYPSVSSVYMLSADDIAGAQALYGPGTSPTPTPTPTATPTPPPTATPTPAATPTPTSTPIPTPTSSVQITVQTNPTGLSFTVDGVKHTSAQTFSWKPGSSHTIATTSPQHGTTGTRYMWKKWSDSGTMSQVVVVPTQNTSYAARFATQYYLTMSAGGGGTVSPGSGWKSRGSVVNITATASTGHTFSNWAGNGTGSFSGTTNPVSVTIDGPISEAASFK